MSDEKELTAEEIAIALNTREWRGLTTWLCNEACAYTNRYGFRRGRPDEPYTCLDQVIPINDAHALVAGWRAAEERDALDTVPRSRYDACDRDYFEAKAELERVRKVAQAEIERLEAELAALRAGAEPEERNRQIVSEGWTAGQGGVR